MYGTIYPLPDSRTLKTKELVHGVCQLQGKRRNTGTVVTLRSDIVGHRRPVKRPCPDPFTGDPSFSSFPRVAMQP